jgi:hypothetical protein
METRLQRLEDQRRHNDRKLLKYPNSKFLRDHARYLNVEIMKELNKPKTK